MRQYTLSGIGKIYYIRLENEKPQNKRNIFDSPQKLKILERSEKVEGNFKI